MQRKHTVLSKIEYYFYLIKKTILAFQVLVFCRINLSYYSWTIILI